MSGGRPQKVADLIQRELSDLLRREVRDPRVGMVTLTSVDVSPDLSHAKVFFTILDKEKKDATAKGLQRAARPKSPRWWTSPLAAPPGRSLGMKCKS